MIPLMPLVLKWWGKRWVKLLLLGIAVAAIATLGWIVRGWKADADELARIKPAYESMIGSLAAANAKVETLKPLDEAERRALAEERARLEAERAAISRAWGRISAVEVRTDETTGCPVQRLSVDWGVCFFASAGGDPADVAACEAAGGDGAVETGGGGGSL